MNHAGLRPIPDHVCFGLSGFSYFAFETNFEFVASLGAAFAAGFAVVFEIAFGATLRFAVIPENVLVYG